VAVESDHALTDVLDPIWQVASRFCGWGMATEQPCW